MNKKKIEFFETTAQPYKNMKISAGLCFDKKKLCDSIYLKLEKDKKPEQNRLIIFTPDEAQAIVWCVSGAVWSYFISVIGRKKMRDSTKLYITESNLNKYRDENR